MFLQNTASRTPYECYIDESGDEGFGRHSPPWFLLTAVVVKRSDEVSVRGAVDRIRQSLWTDRGKQPPSVLHWRRLKHKQKLVIANDLNELPFCQMTVGIWKHYIDKSCYIGQSSSLFRYACRFLLERISWYVDENNGWVRITFSNRKKFDLISLRDYIYRVCYDPGHQIRLVFDPLKIRVMDMRQLKMLQIADACASATGNAFNPDEFGQLHPFYLECLLDRLYRRRGKLLSYGLKMFPDAEFKQHYPVEYPFLQDWLKKGRSQAPRSHDT